MKISGAILALALALVSTSARAAGESEAIDALFSQWNTPSSPGCVVGVSRDGRVLFQRAYGQADLEHDAPNGLSTIFDIASTSKQFMAAVTLLLVQDGRIALSDDVRKYVPELPDYGDVITIDHLLNHTSGLRDWRALGVIAGWPRWTRVYTQADVLDMVARQRRLNHRPGTDYHYTNAGYFLLGLIAERVSGMPLDELSRTRLFAPLGMTSTSWGTNFRTVVRNRAIAYGRSQSNYVQLMPFENTYGHGRVLTTTTDMLLWNDALDHGRLGRFVTTELQRRGRLSDGREINYARGLYVGQYHGFREIAHSGGTAGYQAWLGRYPDQHLSVALTCNTSEARVTSLSHHIADLFLPPARTAAAPRHLPSHATERTGSYINQRDGMLFTLVAENGRLGIEGGPVLEPATDTVMRAGNDEFAFAGRDRFTRTDADGEQVSFQRSTAAAPAADFTDLAGRYRSEEVDATYVVAVESGQIVVRIDRRPSIRMVFRPMYRDAFQGDEYVLRFNRDGTGQVTSLSVSGLPIWNLQFDRMGTAAAAAGTATR